MKDELENELKNLSVYVPKDRDSIVECLDAYVNFRTLVNSVVDLERCHDEEVLQILRRENMAYELTRKLAAHYDVDVSNFPENLDEPRSDGRIAA